MKGKVKILESGKVLVVMKQSGGNIGWDYVVHTDKVDNNGYFGPITINFEPSTNTGDSMKIVVLIDATGNLEKYKDALNKRITAFGEYSHMVIVYKR
ncbi:MAG: hypothetical protein K8T10_16085 [Candidatus Eremiobacteraeota bacterium]|nr:hypothetical protein [Candidatus Eremiobacteraeota bacterium]